MSNHRLSIDAYRGYSNGHSIWVSGRVLRKHEVNDKSPDSGRMATLRLLVSRWATREVAGVVVCLSASGQNTYAVTDSEGYYSARFDGVDPQLARDGVAAQMRSADASAHHDLLVLPAGPQYALISDIDDTVLHTGIGSPGRALKLTLATPVSRREPLPGAADLYRRWVREHGDHDFSPVFYLSNSPWNLYSYLKRFLDERDFPFGPLLLRDFGYSSFRGSHKDRTLIDLYQRFPETRFVLIGDAGQRDAEHYFHAIELFPGRTAAVFIRDVDPHSPSKRDLRVDHVAKRAGELDVPFSRVGSSQSITDRAAELGLLPEGPSLAETKSPDRRPDKDMLSEARSYGFGSMRRLYDNVRHQVFDRL